MKLFKIIQTIVICFVFAHCTANKTLNNLSNALISNKPIHCHINIALKKKVFICILPFANSAAEEKDRRLYKKSLCSNIMHLYPKLILILTLCNL